MNLTHPEIDILDETVRVESFNNESSVYIPANAVLASELSLCLYSCLLIARLVFVS